jgi:hypothetical protein
MSKLATGYAVIFAVALATAPAAFAQLPDAKGCTPQERDNQTLQDAGRTASTICPPDVDSAMKPPAPKTGDQSVTPPQGPLGKDPNVQPK